MICTFAYEGRHLRNSPVPPEALCPPDCSNNLPFRLQRVYRQFLRCPKRQWPRRIAWAIVVNCELPDNCHRAAASAHAFPLMLPSRERWSALPGKPDFSSDKKVTPLEEYATRTSGRRMHFYVKVCDSVPGGKLLSAGAILGSGARCPKPQSPHVLYCRKSLSASFRSSSFPVRNQCTPTFAQRQQFILLEHSQGMLLQRGIPKWDGSCRKPSANSPPIFPLRSPIVPEKMINEVAKRSITQTGWKPGTQPRPRGHRQPSLKPKLSKV